MEIDERVYKRKSTSKKYIRLDANHDIRVRKQKVGEAAFPTKPKKGRAVERKKNMQAIQTISQLVEKHARCMDPDTPQRSVKD